MAKTSESAVVLLSGGLDSSTLLHYVAKTLGQQPVYALSFDYGQRHAKELACAAWQAQAGGATEHRVVDISFVADLLGRSTALTKRGGEVPDLAQVTRDQRDQPPTYVPNRNMMLLSIAAAYAEARGAQNVFYGAHALDEYGYWDCTEEFVARLNATLALNRRKAVTVHAPFVKMQKAESLKLGLELGVDYAHTWSCYRGQDVACGTCPTCVERLNAFREVGVEDPLACAD